MWNFLAGKIFGVMLSISSVCFDTLLPDRVELPDALRKSPKTFKTMPQYSGNSSS